MIVKALLSIVFGLINILLSLIKFPSTPEWLIKLTNTFFSLLKEPIQFVGWLIGPQFLQVAFAILLVVGNGHRLYAIALWFYGKIRGGS